MSSRPTAATIRPATPADAQALYSVHSEAFPSVVEAHLVAQLCSAAKDRVSLVAESGGEVVGHILFSPVTLDGVDVGALGLAPLAVRPVHQRRGIGGELIEAGLAVCRTLEVPWVVVLGDPAYYGRFGFTRASERGLENAYGVDEPFQVIELVAGTLAAAGGRVDYAREFADLDS